MQKLIALFMYLISLFCGVFGIPYYAAGEKLELDRFELVWSDEFNGSAVDETVWRGHYVWGDYTVRRGGYWDKKMASVADGKLTDAPHFNPVVYKYV